MQRDVNRVFSFSKLSICLCSTKILASFDFFELERGNTCEMETDSAKTIGPYRKFKFVPRERLGYLNFGKRKFPLKDFFFKKYLEKNIRYLGD